MEGASGYVIHAGHGLSYPPTNISIGTSGQMEYSDSFTIAGMSTVLYVFAIDTWDYSYHIARSVDMELFVDSLPLSTPTVTPTGTVSSDYCASINASMLPNPFSFNGTGAVVRQYCTVIPEINLGVVVDYFIPSFGTWSLLLNTVSEFFEEYLTTLVLFDPLTICIRERDYSLYLFTVRMPIEFIFGLGIFLSALRMFVPGVFSGASMIGASRHSGDSDKGK